MKTLTLNKFCSLLALPLLLAATPANAQSAITQDPKPVAIKQPLMPPALLTRGIHEGSLSVLMEIGADGSVQDWLVVSTTEDMLVRAINDVIGEWRFSPSVIDGEPIDSTIRIHVNFRTEGVVLTLNGTERMIGHIADLVGNREHDLVADFAAIDSIPEPLEVVQPQMFKDEQEQPITGEVLVTFYIDRDGQVRIPTLTELDGDPVIAQSALHALRQWHFRAPTVGGRPVIVRAQQRFIFRESPGQTQAAATASAN